MCSGDGPHGIDKKAIPRLLDELVRAGSLSPIVEAGRNRFLIADEAVEEASQILLDANMVEKLKRRHFDWCATLAMWAGPELFSSERGNWFDILKLEGKNLVAALMWSLENAPEDGVGMAGALLPVWLHVDGAQPGRGLFIDLLKSDRVSSDAKKVALVSAGHAARAAGNEEEARTLYSQSFGIANSEVGDKTLMGVAFLAGGDGAAIGGDVETAEVLYRRANSIAEELGDKEVMAEALLRIGNSLRSRSEYSRASEMLERSLQIFRELNEPDKVDSLLHALGSLKVLQGDYSGAISLLEERSEE